MDKTKNSNKKLLPRLTMWAISLTFFPNLFHTFKNLHGFFMTVCTLQRFKNRRIDCKVRNYCRVLHLHVALYQGFRKSHDKLHVLLTNFVISSDVGQFPCQLDDNHHLILLDGMSAYALYLSLFWS